MSSIKVIPSENGIIDYDLPFWESQTAKWHPLRRADRRNRLRRSLSGIRFHIWCHEVMTGTWVALCTVDMNGNLVSRFKLRLILITKKNINVPFKVGSLIWLHCFKVFDISFFMSEMRQRLREKLENHAVFNVEARSPKCVMFNQLSARCLIWCIWWTP